VFRVWFSCFLFGVTGLEPMVWGLGCRLMGLGFGVLGMGLGVSGLVCQINT
jgi:hypothetical protein